MSTLSTILAAILGIVFLGTGIAKLMGQQGMVDNFERWGLGRPGRVITGSVEVLCALMLLTGIAVASLAIGGAMLVFVLMVGAVLTHGRVKDPPGDWVPPVVLLVLAIVLLYSLLPEG